MLNFDILIALVSHVFDLHTLSSLALTSHLFNEAATPQLYKSITIRIRNDADKQPAIFETFQKHPEYKLYVHHVEQIGPECYGLDEAENADLSDAPWIHFLEGLPNLYEYALRPWSHLGFIPSVRAQTALAALRRTGARVHTISLDFEGVFSPSSLAFCFASLRRINLNMVGMEADEQHPVLACCQACPNLEHVGFVGLRPQLFLPVSQLRLISFTVGSRYSGFQFKDLVSLLQYMPHLKYLDMFSHFPTENLPEAADVEHYFPHLFSLTIRYRGSRYEFVDHSFDLTLRAWTLLLVERTSPESLALFATDHIGYSGNVLVSRIATLTCEKLVSLRVPYMSCNGSVVRAVLASCANLKELSLAVKETEAVALFHEPSFLHKPPLQTLTLHCWIPKAQMQVDDAFAKGLLTERAPHLMTFVVDGKMKWESQWVMDYTSDPRGCAKREIRGPEQYVYQE